VVLFIAVIYFTQFYANPGELESFIRQFGQLSIIAFISSVTLANVAAPISASPLLLLGFSIYGKNAIWFFALGNIIAMGINFYIARKIGRAIMIKLVGESNVDKIDTLSQNYGLFALFLVRMFLSGISDLASYAFGLSPIRFRPYIIVSVIGTLPPYLLLYFFSKQNQTSLEFLLMQFSIAGVLAAVFLVTRYLKNRFLQLLLKGT
jgi:uncharacterized membrane protein YdjX (TVP38/TMEM64 family)